MKHETFSCNTPCFATITPWRVELNGTEGLWTLWISWCLWYSWWSLVKLLVAKHNFLIFIVAIVYHILKNYNAAVPRKICTLDILHLKQDSTQNFKSQHRSSIHIISCCSIWHAHHFSLCAVAHATTAHLLLSKALGQQHWLLRWWESSHRLVGVEGDSQDIGRFNLGDVMGCVKCGWCVAKFALCDQYQCIYIYMFKTYTIHIYIYINITLSHTSYLVYPTSIVYRTQYIWMYVLYKRLTLKWLEVVQLLFR